MRFALMLLLLLAGTVTSWADFKDFSVQVNNQGGTLLTPEEIATQGTAFEFGVAVAGDGTVSRVATDDASSVATVSGKYHSDHGATGLKVVVPVEGTVKITVGQCTYSGNAIKVTNSAGTEVVTKTPATACWKNDHANITELYYTGEATTLTITGMGYCPYVAVEKSEAVINKYNIVYTLGTEADVTGNVPATVTWTEGDTYAIPANYTLYKEGYTLTGWNDGANTVAVGAEYTPAADVTMTPVFTQNTVSLADRKEPVTLKWNFRRDQGAPTVGWEGKSAQPWVTQATINGETIDVKMDVTTSPGKFNNGSNIDWAQCNSGTTFTIPNAKGAVVSTVAYNNFTTTTIDGQIDYEVTGSTGSYSTSYTVANTAETIDVVIGDGSYYRYIQTVLPAIQEEGGKTYTNEPASVVWAFNDAEAYDSNVKTPANGFNTVAVNLGASTITGVGSGTVAGVTFIKVKPATGGSDVIEWTLTPAKGLTFTPTKVSGYINRGATDAENGVTVSLKLADGTSEVLGNYTAARFNKSQADDKFGASANYASSFDITLTEEQQQKLSSNDAISLVATIGVGNSKEGFFSDIHVDGLLNGTVEEVNKYTVSVATSPVEGGSATIYPKSEEYVENDEVTLTATENFGYDFANWTDKDGAVISEDAKFKYTVTANAELTANFKKVNAYALDITVEGQGKDYMITYTPAPTVVDGKNMYEEGTTVKVAAASNEVVKFNSWSNGETTPELSLAMTEDIALTATYSASDFLAIWDFWKKGNNGRIADFSTEGNEAATLVMRDEAGNIAGWLDKSKESGEYEGRPGAVNWKNDVAIGTYYWQTSVDASNYKNLKVQSAMVYNYNAYQTYNVEYSLNGENWTKLGAINMPGVKNWTDLTVDVPADADNQPKVYFRWIADKTSKIDGTESKNDGACLGAIYITGVEEIIDDGKAPVVKTTVPAEGSNTASANGKIVITFDKKIQLTADAKATLGTQELKPEVSGMTLICQYKGLSYSTDYVFTLKANSVVDLTGNNKVADDIVINFTTKVKPTVEKALYDFIVPTDGTISEALAAANKRGPSATDRFRIFIADGNYVFDTNGTTTGGDGNTYPDPRSYLTSPNVSFIGQSMEGVVITNQTPDATWDNGYGKACPLEGIGKGDVLIISKDGHDAYFQNLTMKSSMGDAHGRDIVLNDQSNRTIFKDACLWAYQDTYVSNSDKGKFYFEGGVLRGRTDFLCGKGDVYYNQVTLRQIADGYLAVPSVPKKYGYIFESCKIIGDTDGVNGKYTLGRPWGSGTPIALFINTEMEVAPSPIGWSEMSGGWPARFAEYNSHLTSGTIVDLAQRKTSFGITDKNPVSHPNDPILTAEEAAEYTLATVMGQDDDWDPTALTEQASAPENVTISEKTITWDDSNYVLCWVVFKNGKFVEATTTNSYEVDDASAEWSVRAANEMGGLGEATVATTGTGISNVETGNAAGINTVSKFIENGKVVIVKDGKKFSAAGQMLK